SSVITGVPPQFDDLVRHATARDPAQRYADAGEMGDDLEAIIDELRLPPFRVPAPRVSAQHASTVPHQAPPAPPPPPAAPQPRQQTRAFARQEFTEPEYQPVSGQFAGVDLDEFHWARQRS